MTSKESRIVKKLKQQSRVPEFKTPIGTDLFLPNHSGDHSSGRVLTTPTSDLEIANKAYVDSVSSGAPEGTAVKSTGEVGGTKFLREDGDNTCSWQSPAGGGDVTAALALTDATLVQGDGGAKGVKTSAVTEADVVANTAKISYTDAAAVTANTAKVTNVSTDLSLGTKTATTMDVNSSDGTNATLIEADTTNAGLLGKAKWDEIVVNTTHAASNGSGHADVASNTTHRNDNTQAHSDYLKNDAVDVGVGLSLSGDNASADTKYVPNVLYNTDATPPVASTVPIGTIYIQYTA